MDCKGVSLIALIITVICLLILSGIAIKTGMEQQNNEIQNGQRCLIGYPEHDYITISKYDNLRKQYYNTAICTRCGHELKIEEVHQ